MENLMIQILKDEVKPATGCTEPVAVALAVAKAKAILDQQLGHVVSPEGCKLTVSVSPNLFKNGLGVGIPNCSQRGLHVASALGLFACNATDGLKVFENMPFDAVKAAEVYLVEQSLNLNLLDTAEKVRVEVLLSQGTDTLKLVLSGTHDHISSAIFNGTSVHAAGDVAVNGGVDKSAFFEQTIETLVTTIAGIAPEKIAFLNEGLIMNRKMAEAGLKPNMGMGVGYGIKQCIESGDMCEDLVNRAMCLTAAASDARMSGLNMSVMSSNGSGNNGLTAILPLAAYFESHDVSEADQLRALAMSHLINCYVKERIGRLSAMCSCAISAATGSGAAIAWLMTKKPEHVSHTIQNMTGNLSGMICDGAKEGCALKLATGAAAGVQAALLSKHGVVMPSANGIVGRTAEESIAHLGILSQKGMQLTDGVILGMMKDML